MAKTLFKDVADFRTVFPQFHSSGDDADIFPYLEDASVKYIYDFISEDLYDELRDALVAAEYVIDDLTAEEKAVINHLRRAEAYYGIYEAMPFMLSEMSSAGNKESSLDGSNAPRQWVVNMTTKSALEKADFSLEKMLKVMESDPGSYTTWSESSAFTIYHQYLLSNADEFQGINGSRRTFLKLKPYIKLAEDKYIESAISRDLIDALVTKKKAGTAFSSYEAQLVEYLYYAESYYALFMGAPELRLNVSGDGIRLVNTNDGITSKMSATDQAGTNNQWMLRMESNAKYYMGRAKMYLDDNAAEFADYTTEAQNKQEPNIYSNDAISGTDSSIMV